MTSQEEVIQEEVEALQAIMGEDEIDVTYGDSGSPTEVQVIVKPATAQNVDLQHVIVTLAVKFSPGYPDESPSIFLRNPRGIDDSVLQSIMDQSVVKCSEYLGFPIVYELIEEYDNPPPRYLCPGKLCVREIKLVREKLTENNAPSCPCAICLFHFTESDSFFKTECFHYFHSHCLGRYILKCKETAEEENESNQQPLWVTKTKRQLLCPVCREPIDQTIDCENLLKKPEPIEGQFLRDFCPEDPQLKELQQKMAALFNEQKLKGGIIDLEVERKRFLITSTASENASQQQSSQRKHSVKKPPAPKPVKPTEPKPKKSNAKSGRPCQGKYQRRLQAYENGYDKAASSSKNPPKPSS